MEALWKKYKEVFLYLVFGVLTTIINIATYHILYNNMNVANKPSTCIAWVLGVLFAFVTNKLFVFESKTETFQEFLKELGSFVMYRLLTGVMDLGIMTGFVDLNWFGMKAHATLVKAASNVLVVILNYIASKLVIFKDKK